MSWTASYQAPEVKKLAEFCQEHLGIPVTLTETGETWGDSYYGTEDKLYQAEFTMEDRSPRTARTDHHVGRRQRPTFSTSP